MIQLGVIGIRKSQNINAGKKWWIKKKDEKNEMP
jgi:hypothetical protein